MIQYRVMHKILAFIKVKAKYRTKQMNLSKVALYMWLISKYFYFISKTMLQMHNLQKAKALRILPTSLLHNKQKVIFNKRLMQEISNQELQILYQ